MRLEVIPERLDEAIKTWGQRPANLAEVLGVAQSQVSNWRYGRLPVPVRYVDELAGELGVDRNYLCGIRPVTYDTTPRTIGRLTQSDIVSYRDETFVDQQEASRSNHRREILSFGFDGMPMLTVSRDTRCSCGKTVNPQKSSRGRFS